VLTARASPRSLSRRFNDHGRAFYSTIPIASALC
jgi:hypothetical protein